MILPNFAKNCMKLRKFSAVRGGVCRGCPPKSATAETNHEKKIVSQHLNDALISRVHAVIYTTSSPRRRSSLSVCVYVMSILSLVSHGSNCSYKVFCGGDDLFQYRRPVFDLFLPTLTSHVTWQVT